MKARANFEDLLARGTRKGWMVSHERMKSNRTTTGQGVDIL